MERGRKGEGGEGLRHTTEGRSPKTDDLRPKTLKPKTEDPTTEDLRPKTEGPKTEGPKTLRPKTAQVAGSGASRCGDTHTASGSKKLMSLERNKSEFFSPIEPQDSELVDFWHSYLAIAVCCRTIATFYWVRVKQTIVNVMACAAIT